MAWPSLNFPTCASTGLPESLAPESPAPDLRPPDSLPPQAAAATTRTHASERTSDVKCFMSDSSKRPARLRPARTRPVDFLRLETPHDSKRGAEGASRDSHPRRLVSEHPHRRERLLAQRRTGDHLCRRAQRGGRHERLLLARGRPDPVDPSRAVHDAVEDRDLVRALSELHGVPALGLLLVPMSSPERFAVEAHLHGAAVRAKPELVVPVLRG